MKQNFHWVLLDVRNIVWTGLLVGKDEENGQIVSHPNPEKAAEGKTVLVNSWQHGFDNALDYLVSVMDQLGVTPMNMIAVEDGEGGKKFREALYPEYKAGRDDNRPEEAYEQFNICMDKLREVFYELGMIQVKQKGMEADDVLAYLAGNLQGRKTIVSTDGDMLRLIDSTTDVMSGFNINEPKYGVCPFEFTTVYKALVGDNGDNIKGAKGFGPKSFIELFVTFEEEGLRALEQLIVDRQLERLQEDVAELKVLQKIIDSKESVYVSYDVARLYPERVNRPRVPWQVKAGMVQPFDPKRHDDRLKSFYGQSRLVHAANYDAALRWFKSVVANSPAVALDIETSTDDESDEWLEAKSRAKDKDSDDKGVDVFGSELAGLGVTFGSNMQYSFYLTHNHLETAEHKNLSLEQVRQLVEAIPDDKNITVHNAQFELPVLFNSWGKEWLAAGKGWRGFLPRVEDTRIKASYVDENRKHNLKGLSLDILGYQQTTYAEVTQGRKMHEMTAAETFGYGTDDTICTAALNNYFNFIMCLEHTIDVYYDVEVKSQYLSAKGFLDGFNLSMEKLLELERDDDAIYDKAWEDLRSFLISKGWEGTVCPKFTPEISAAEIKTAHLLVTGRPLDTQVRTPNKLVTLIEHNGEELLARLVDQCIKGDPSGLNDLVASRFSGEPEINLGSPKQIGDLLYTTVGLPVRLRNPPTDAMRAKGIREGSPRTDDLTMLYALKMDAESLSPDATAALKAIQSMKTIETKRKMFYKPYKFVRHWKDNRVHPGIQQSATNTRRHVGYDPNVQQMPKHKKYETMDKPRFREVMVPHHANAVVVSLDFSAQELRIIAKGSGDQNMISCYVGENKRDIHSMTGTGMANKRGFPDWSYEDFAAAVKDESHPNHYDAKDLRAKAKPVNFSTEYGAMAGTVAEKLLVSEEEAQTYIDAKEAMFPVSYEWKKGLIKEARNTGRSYTMLGAVRHLEEAIFRSDKWTARKAERQAVNVKIQGSAAEQTKLSMGRVWDSGVLFDYDCRFIAPIHDEMVFSINVDHLVPALRLIHGAMTADYAGMSDTVPIVSEISFGPNFGEQHEVGDHVDEARIYATLAKLGFKQFQKQEEIAA